MARLPAVGRETYRRVGVWAYRRNLPCFTGPRLIPERNAAMQQNSPAAPKNSVIFAG